MIFASDLDRTLIYSNRFFDATKPDMPIRNVEIYKGKEISFMTEKAIDLLRELSEQMMFLPVTTRTVDQYKRISLFQEEIRPKYAVTCNGGVILENGQVDRDWQGYMEAKINQNSTPLEEVKKKISQTADSVWLESIRVVDHFFIYLIIKPELAPAEVMNEYAEWAAECGWIFSLQGRKVYFVPSFVNKWDAVQYLSEKEGKKQVFTAGDSYLDLCLIEKSGCGLIPRHGEAAAKHGHLGLTKASGILAAEEILEAALAKRLEAVSKSY
ncbi:HAD family hydrolase [Pseudobacillus sp. FSL P4-0506]|uniref:HAD family hydrolase n=1 Tax=Pseudobacillus sp. FSL P4-0506 TaxID=2921576 RepID=UPI0030F7DF69